MTFTDVFLKYFQQFQSVSLTYTQVLLAALQAMMHIMGFRISIELAHRLDFVNEIDEALYLSRKHQSISFSVSQLKGHEFEGPGQIFVDHSKGSQKVRGARLLYLKMERKSIDSLGNSNTRILAVLKITRILMMKKRMIQEIVSKYEQVNFMPNTISQHGD